MRANLRNVIEQVYPELCKMADDIYDHPETGKKEFYASQYLVKTLQKAGFQVETGIAGMQTAFRAVFHHGDGGPVIGFMCEYDALEKMGHGCGHHIQGAAVCGAAKALAASGSDKNYTVIVYGTPDEEIEGGKITMLENGCFSELDIVLMCHGYDRTFIDEHYPFSINMEVTFSGTASHAAVAPEKGRSAFDALLLSFQGVEFLREHIKDGARMHYTVLDAGGPSNIVPDTAKGDFCLRYSNLGYLEQMIRRFENIVQGAAMMTETSYSIVKKAPYYGKVNVPSLNCLLLKHAEEAGALRVSGPRPKTGTTDYGNVSFIVPSALLGIAMVQEGVDVHTEAFLAAGKTEGAHRAFMNAACAMAESAMDIIEDNKLLYKIKKEFAENKENMESV